MPKQTRESTPGDQAAFEAAMERIQAVTGARTQVQLAEALEVRQSSISDAKRRCSIPDGWCVKLLRTHQVLPDWILTGEGPKFLGEAAGVALRQTMEHVQALQADYAASVMRMENALDIISLTDAELARRKTLAIQDLQTELARAKGAQGELSDIAAGVAAQAH